jgi:hemerythrin-like domain-containing protein
MSEILSRLHQDHRNMISLLDLLEKQMADTASGNDHHFGLMSEIVDYFNHYPAISHHPIEDEIFEWVRGQRPRLGELVAELRAEHAAQADLGREVAMFLQGIAGGHLVPRAQIVEKLNLYIGVQRRHIDKEEAHLLKETADLLTELEFTEIPLQSGIAPDPLFGANPELAYTRVIEALARD